MMIPRSLVKHQYQSVGTKGGSGRPAVFMFPVKVLWMDERQSEKEWGAVQVSMSQRTSCCVDSLMPSVQNAWIKPSGECEGVHEPGAQRRKELLIWEKMELWGQMSVGQTLLSSWENIQQ